MNNICFVFDTHYPNYTRQLREGFLTNYQKLKLHEQDIHVLISTNRPNDFDEFISDHVRVFDINELRKEYPISLEFEKLPEDPTGLYPRYFPWNLERFILKKAGELGFNYVINLDSDVNLHPVIDVDNSTTAEQIKNMLLETYEENTVATNQALFFYEKDSELNEVFHLHKKYIDHFQLDFTNQQYTTLDGPLVAYMGKTPEDILRYFDIWNSYAEFGYKKDFQFGYENIVCGVWSLTIPSAGFTCKSKSFPFIPFHRYEDRY